MSSGQEGAGCREGQECHRLEHKKRREKRMGTRRRMYMLDSLPEISGLWTRLNPELEAFKNPESLKSLSMRAYFQ